MLFELHEILLSVCADLGGTPGADESRNGLDVFVPIHLEPSQEALVLLRQPVARVELGILIQHLFVLFLVRQDILDALELVFRLCQLLLELGVLAQDLTVRYSKHILPCGLPVGAHADRKGLAAVHVSQLCDFVHAAAAARRRRLRVAQKPRLSSERGLQKDWCARSLRPGPPGCAGTPLATSHA